MYFLVLLIRYMLLQKIPSIRVITYRKENTKEKFVTVTPKLTGTSLRMPYSWEALPRQKIFLLFSFDLHQKYWFCRYNKHNSEIDIWKQDSTEPTKAFAKKPVGITNDIDGYNLSLSGFRYIDDRHFVRFVTPDNADEIKKIVTESTNVKFPESVSSSWN